MKKLYMQDLYIGSEVVFNNFHFVLIGADEYALRYMEYHCDQFPHANINLILAKLKGPASSHIETVNRKFSAADAQSTGEISYKTFRYYM